MSQQHPPRPLSRPSLSVERLADAAASEPAGPLFAALTAMLHRAYAAQIAMGLQPLAGRQDAATTARRCRSGETWLAWLGAQPGQPDPSYPVGMVVLHEVEEAGLPEWFLRPDVAHFSLLAVDPLVQRGGVGAALLSAIEQRVAAQGFAEIALSMAEPDTNLLAWYTRRGYRFIERWQWPYTNYRSLILSRAVGNSVRSVLA